jgi:hypothetical protein
MTNTCDQELLKDVRYVLTDQGRATLLEMRHNLEMQPICSDCGEPEYQHVRRFLGSRRCWVELEWDS